MYQHQQHGYPPQYGHPGAGMDPRMQQHYSQYRPPHPMYGYPPHVQQQQQHGGMYGNPATSSGGGFLQGQRPPYFDPRMQQQHAISAQQRQHAPNPEGPDPFQRPLSTHSDASVNSATANLAAMSHGEGQPEPKGKGKKKKAAAPKTPKPRGGSRKKGAAARAASGEGEGRQGDHQALILTPPDSPMSNPAAKHAHLADHRRAHVGSPAPVNSPGPVAAGGYMNYGMMPMSTSQQRPPMHMPHQQMSMQQGFHPPTSTMQSSYFPPARMQAPSPTPYGSYAMPHSQPPQQGQHYPPQKIITW